MNRISIIIRRNKVVFYILASLFVWVAGVSGEFVSKSIIEKAEKRYGLFALNRFMALQRLVRNLENADELTKLEKVNDFWNGVRYGDDKDIWGVSDYWATPWEFLAKDTGDCEDYVIAKYFTLKYLGVKTEKMFFTYVRAIRYEKPHMVLTYFAKPESMPLILDNINYRIFSASEREDLTPIYSFNGDKLSEIIRKQYKKSNSREMKIKRKWDKLIDNIKKGKI